MSKLMTDLTGQEIAKAIKAIPAASGGGGGSGSGLDLPPVDGKSYVMKDGKWTEALIATGTAATPSPETTVINQEGETSVTFFIPWKFAMEGTRTALNDYGHTSWRFPFSAGTIKKVSMKAANPGSVKADLLMDGSSVLGEPKALTTAWTDYTVDVTISQDQPLEIYVSQDLLASDLTVSVTMDVGNKVIEFVGESDIQPNVYAKGSKASTWGKDGQDSPDGQFRSVYMPAVNKLKQLWGGFAARDGNVEGKWYVCGDYKYLGHAMSEAPSTPIEMPVDDVVDVAGAGNSSSAYLIYLTLDGRAYYYSSIGTVTFIDYSTQLIASLANVYGCATTFGHMLKYHTTTLTLPITGVVKKFYVYYTNMYYVYYLNTEKALGYFKSGTHYEIPFDKGIIKDFFTPYNTDSFFVLTEDNELYAKGQSISGCLGLSPTEGMTSATATTTGGAYYNDWTKVGEWDVKEIQSIANVTFMLTNDGKLYHAGAAAANLVPTQHNAFTQVFPNYRFHDIALAGTAANAMTLVAIAEYLGEIAE